MKKYRGLLLSVSVAAMLMGSCMAVHAEETEAVSEAATEVVAETVAEGELIESDRQALEQFAQGAIEMIVNADEKQLAEYANPSSILDQTPEAVRTAAAAWSELKEDLGAYQGVESFVIDTDKDIVIEALCNFENGTNKAEITLSDDDFTIEGFTFETKDASFGQKMKEAVLNTIMGVSIVFLMLLFLSALISQFANINKIEQLMKKKNAPAPAQTPAAAPVAAPVVEEEVVDDGELIAVIAAAIAAAEGTSTDGFVVRSIKKSNRNKWQRA